MKCFAAHANTVQTKSLVFLCSAPAYAKGEQTNATNKEMKVMSTIVNREDLVVNGLPTAINAPLCQQILDRAPEKSLRFNSVERIKPILGHMQTYYLRIPESPHGLMWPTFEAALLNPEGIEAKFLRGRNIEIPHEVRASFSASMAAADSVQL